MTILAHPDDETAVGTILAKYGEDNKVYLVLASDGRYGVTEHAGIPAGDSLVRVRESETICSCDKLGIEPPVFLRFHDGLGMVSGLGEYFGQTTQLKEKIKEKIEEINPDIILTFGPDGDTGHPDHRGISDITTEVILREGWYEKYPLYYIGWSKDKLIDLPQDQKEGLNYVDTRYLNIRIKYTDSDKEKLFKSLSCHKSQFSESEMTEWIKTEKLDSLNIFYFRQFRTDTEQRTDF
jgi:LmbE family N-acetylglucosaminyl deacetylase